MIQMRAVPCGGDGKNTGAESWELRWERKEAVPGVFSALSPHQGN